MSEKDALGRVIEDENKEKKDGWKANFTLARIKVVWDEQPMTVIAVGALGIMAFARLIDSVSAAQERRAYVRHLKDAWNFRAYPIYGRR